MSVYKKLLEARKIIREAGIEKDGRNEFSKYNYFTPDGVKAAVGGACQEVGLLPVFNLIQDEVGLHGRLTIFDIEDGDDIEFKIATKIPEITATNVTQQVGGCITYTERYSLMVAFEIADNKLDFDAQDNTGKTVEVKEFATPAPFLEKRIHISAEETKVFEAEKENVMPPIPVETEKITEEEDTDGELSELDQLRAACDELGIKYSGRHKEAGLTKLINEYDKEMEKSGAGEQTRSFSAEPEGPENDEIEPEMDEEAIQMAMNEYLSKVESYVNKEELKNDSPILIQDAVDGGIPDSEIAVLKATINDKYRSLT